MNMHTVELANHYRDVRKRLGMGTPVRKITTVAIAPVRIVETKPTAPLVAPLWTVVNLYFDWHIRVWHEAIGQQVSALAHENVALRAALHVNRMDMDVSAISRRPTKHIIAEVLENFPGVSWEDIKGHRRTRDIVYPRQLCMFEVQRQRKDLSYPAIGRIFGGRDHTTVLHSVRKIQSMTSDDRTAAIWMQRKHTTRIRPVKPSVYVQTRMAKIQAGITE